MNAKQAKLLRRFLLKKEIMKFEKIEGTGVFKFTKESKWQYRQKKKAFQSLNKNQKANLVEMMKAALTGFELSFYKK